MPEAIKADALIPMDIFPGEPFLIDIVYADKNHPHNIFGCALYHESARLILQRDMARIILLCARALRETHGWTLVLKDGLRPVEAQARMAETNIVKENPHWLEGPRRMLSSPGVGAHPRGMAIDVSVIDRDNNPVDMGTVFDEMTEQSARDYTGFSALVLENRRILQTAFTDSAAKLDLPMLPLPSEWWDFRFPSDYTRGFAPLSDADLPDDLKICVKRVQADAGKDAALAKSVLLSL
ncbi:MAG: D-Ala-D-Ala dipeptidase [Micavibrio aeruginosavorus]|uniref:D-Ala-D-Ala dipeptidase n=1 Tax=Micavibrio aeruginosavorus TaxID=349221 RepID=A0A2W5BVU8_9BACT|nr:MAG: D-Ala-D-Ala dipeptidase [Micavibrio aeruginosavorus]